MIELAFLMPNKGRLAKNYWFTFYITYAD